eukprot:scaffold287106_cov18-Tisochrysis_lutea.AAC.1
MDYALAMATLGFIATAVGQALLHVYTKKKMQRGSRCVSTWCMGNCACIQCAFTKMRMQRGS